MRVVTPFDLSARRIAVIYAVFGFLWVTGSDAVVERLPNHLIFHTVTGWAFVVVSAGLVYVLVTASHAELSRTSSRLESTNAHATILHRVLRHDIRNACTSILGYAELVEPRRDIRVAIDPVEVIRKRANRLVEVSDEISLLRSVEQAEGTTVEFDLSRAVTDAVQDARLEHPSASLSVSVPSSLSVVGHPALPRSISELLDNAVVHSDRAAPNIDVTARRQGDVSCVVVTDDGPGIPDIERDALNLGSESPLTHTSGVGLWLVRAIVEASDGSLDIESLVPQGTAVTLCVPTTGS